MQTQKPTKAWGCGEQFPVTSPKTRPYLTLLLTLLTLFLVSACAGKAPSQPKATSPADAGARWNKYLANLAQNKPYRLSLSLRFGQRGESRRVTALLWGNSSDRMRLDVMAGVGTTLAKLEASPDDFLLVAPTDGKAYSHKGSNQPRLKLGVPLPLSLIDLAELLNGEDVRVFGETYAANMPAPSGLIRYLLEGPLPGMIDLDSQGRVLSWKEKQDESGWRMQIEREAGGLPHRIDLTNHKGERLLVLVKEREEPQAFSSEQLAVTIPGGYPVLPIAEYAGEKNFK